MSRLGRHEHLTFLDCVFLLVLHAQMPRNSIIRDVKRRSKPHGHDG